MPMIKKSTQKWKDENSNYKTKVSSATVAKLRQGTKASNIAAANKPGATAEYKEAVRRFYGKGAVSSAPTKVPGPKQTGPVSPGSKKPVIQRGNPKPTQAQINAGKKKKAAVTLKLEAKNAASLKESRMNPKPTQAQMDRAKRAKIAGQAGAVKATRSEQKKPTQGQMTAAKNKKATNASRVDAYKQRNKIARGTNTPASKISGDRYKRGV
jgi:hypothetical protein